MSNILYMCNVGLTRRLDTYMKKPQNHTFILMDLLKNHSSSDQPSSSKCLIRPDSRNIREAGAVFGSISPEKLQDLWKEEQYLAVCHHRNSRGCFSKSRKDP